MIKVRSNESNEIIKDLSFIFNFSLIFTPLGFKFYLRLYLIVSILIILAQLLLFFYLILIYAYMYYIYK